MMVLYNANAEEDQGFLVHWYRAIATALNITSIHLRMQAMHVWPDGGVVVGAIGNIHDVLSYLYLKISVFCPSPP